MDKMSRLEKEFEDKLHVLEELIGNDEKTMEVLIEFIVATSKLSMYTFYKDVFGSTVGMKEVGNEGQE